MKYYQELILLPQTEVPIYFIWSKVYMQLHLALTELQAALGEGKVGVAFPEYVFDAEAQMGKLGSKLRVFAADAAVLQQLEVYDAEKVQGYVMDQSRVTDLLDRLCHMSYDEKCNLPGMRPERADIIVAGVAILDSLMEYFAVSEVKVSDRDLSEGLLNADTMMPKD